MMRRVTACRGLLSVTLALLAVMLTNCDETGQQVFVDDGFDLDTRAVPGGSCTTGHVVACYSEEPAQDENGDAYCLEGIRECQDDGTWSECNLGEDVAVRHELIGDPELCGGCDPACFRTRDAPTEEELDGENAVNVVWDDVARGVVLGGGARHVFIASDPDSTVSKIRIQDRREVGRYYVGYPWNTGWGGNRPSRSAIDGRGNAYIASRAFGSQGYLTRIAGDRTQCIDRNRNGVIETSTGSVPRAWNEDECVLWNQPICGVDGVPRAVTIDADGLVWVGCYNTRQFQVVNPDNGQVVRTVGVSREPYGAAIDSEGTLWYTTRGCESVWESYVEWYWEDYEYWYWEDYQFWYWRYYDCNCGWRLYYGWGTGYFFDTRWYCCYMYCDYCRYYYEFNVWYPASAYAGTYYVYGYAFGYFWNYVCDTCSQWTYEWRSRYVSRWERRYVSRTAWHWVSYCEQHIQSINTRTNAVGSLRWNRTCNDHYGIAVDLQGRVWVACAHHDPYRLVRYTPSTNRWDGVAGITGYTRGVTLDSTGRVWTSSHSDWWNYGTSWAHGFNPDTLGDMRRFTISGCNGAIGIGADYDDNLWFACHGSSNAVVLNPRTGGTQSTPVGTNPYTYSDFTGNLRAMVTAPEGSYSRLYDARMACAVDQDVLWSQLYYDVSTPSGTSIRFWGRTADRTADLATTPEVLLAEIPSETAPADVEWALQSSAVENGHRYFQVRVELRSADRRSSPVFRNMDMLFYCVNRECEDRMRNGNETDVDCGGDTCQPCATGRSCLEHRDCQTGQCSGGVCVPCIRGSCTGDGEYCLRGACREAVSCNDLHRGDDGLGSGIYSIAPRGGSGRFDAYCDMTRAGGGWTLVAIYGLGGRPGAFTGNAYPRHGASFFGSFNPNIFVAGSNNSGFENYSVNARDLWNGSNREVLAYVGGSTDDYITATLPGGCNYFDGRTWCPESTYGPFRINRSNGSVLTTNGYACTTAHLLGGFGGDPFDEFGLHLLDGLEVSGLHCHMTGSTLGHQAIGRIFTTFEQSNTGYWNAGVHSHWNSVGQFNVPGAIMIR